MLLTTFTFCVFITWIHHPITLAFDTFRLPTHLKPIHYDLAINNRYEYIYSSVGLISIQMICVIGGSKNITIHARHLEINIDKIEVFKEEEEGVEVESTIKGSDENDFFIIYLESELIKGQKYTLDINFAIKDWSTNTGFFKKDYIDKETLRHEPIYGTQFQSIYARKAFPCFDEPGFKATFKLKLTHWRNLTALSNMPKESSIFKGDYSEGFFVEDTFQRTPLMSTYLLAFAVANYTSVSTTVGNPLTTKISIWGKHYDLPLTKLSLQICPTLYLYLYKYFRFSQPLTEEKMILIPDFQTNQMENWGLISYKTSLMLYDKKTDLKSLGIRDHIYFLVGLEFAHLWLGNLVTPKWWNDLWLKEGISTFLSVKSVEYSFPSIQIMDRFLLNEYQHSMTLDSKSKSTPVRPSVKSKADINRVFNFITTGKGAAISRMMEDFVGEEKMKLVFQSYIKKYAYKNVDQNMFFDELNVVDKDIDLKEVMKTWTLQAGYPVINVKIDVKKGSFTVSQKRFILNIHHTQKEEQLWSIPIKYQKVGGIIKMIWLANALNKFNDPKIIGLTKPVIFNINRIGYYRVNYDSENWERIIRQLITNSKLIPSYSRMEIIDDVFNFVLAKINDLVHAFKVSQYLKYEKNSLVRIVFFNHVVDMIPKVFSPENNDHFKVFIKSLISFNFISPSNKIYTHIYSWVLDVKIACQFGLKECVKKSIQEFRIWRQKPSENKIDIDIMNTVTCTAIRYGEKEDWTFLKKQFLKTENEVYLASLSCTMNNKQLNDLIDETTYITSLFFDHRAVTFKNVVLSSYGRNALFYYIKSNEVKYLNVFGDKGYEDSLFSLLEYTTDSKMFDKIAQYILDSKYRTIERKQAKKKIEELYEIMKNNQKDRNAVNKWLEKRKNGFSEKETNN